MEQTRAPVLGMGPPSYTSKSWLLSITEATSSTAISLGLIKRRDRSPPKWSNNYSLPPCPQLRT